VAVIQAWAGGFSTRRVEELVQTMGLNGISKSTVSGHGLYVGVFPGRLGLLVGRIFSGAAKYPDVNGWL
jgi:hypothetical protein